MKKFLIILMMLLIVTGCSNNQENQVLFVKKGKEYALSVDGKLKSKYIYTDYDAVGTDGFLVHNGKKDSYIDRSGKEKIAYKKGVTLKPLENMIIAKDKNKNYTIYDSQGKELYKSSKKVEIIINELPVIHEKDSYLVLDGNGEVVVKSKNKISYTSIYDSSFITVSYEKSTNIYDYSINAKKDENELEIALAGEYQLLAQDNKIGYVLYDQNIQNLVFINHEGEIQFRIDKDIDSASFNKDTIIAKKGEEIYILSTDGSVDVKASSYYKNSQKYLIKNESYVYGPHQFVDNGKAKDVSGIQLNPTVNKVIGDIFPVYVQSKGYQYYDFSGKVKIKTYFKYAGDFTKDGVSVVSKDGKKYYLIDSAGKKLSKNFIRIEEIGNGYYAGYQTNAKFVVLNAQGEKIIDDYFMGNSETYVFDDEVFGLFNKSGTTHVYNMNECEEEFTLEGEYKLYQDTYLVSSDYKKYYDMDGEIYFKR